MKDLINEQPEQDIEHCATCIHAADSEDICIPRKCKYAIAELKDCYEPEQRWIPCSERLPEHGGRYLISVLDGINRRTTVASYLPRCKAWTMTGRMAYWKVIAWLPLPEPYKEVE